ncbi:MAG: hypothetical protein ACI9LX_002352 [Paraglaciecola sp.]|jgi:hypothetical protein
MFLCAESPLVVCAQHALSLLLEAKDKTASFLRNDAIIY